MKEHESERDVFEYDDLTGERPKKRMGPLGYAALAIVLLLVGTGAAAAASRGIAALPARVTEALAAREEPAPTPAASAPGVEASPEPEESPEPGMNSAGGQQDADYERTALIVDGVPVGVLASREAAESVLAETLGWFEMQILGSGTLETTVENEVSLERADASMEAENTSADDLIALLTGADTPLTVRSTLTEEVVAYTGYESVREEDDTLLEGTRIIVRYGVQGETHTIITRTFVNGVEEGEAETVTVTAREAVDALVREGTEETDYDAEPGKREGNKGRDAGELEFKHPTERKRVESNFGQRAGVLHLGLDYSGEGGEDVLAAADGTVVSAIERGGYGLMVEIDHGEGFVTRYAHLDALAVAIGDAVAAGDVIGALGSTGNCSEAHLHFELRIDGVAYNPRYYLD